MKGETILAKVKREMAALMILSVLCLQPLAGMTQTAVSDYTPGVTKEGAVYYLPKTVVRITLQIEKTTYTPGDFCRYADRYLRLKDVGSEPTEEYRIVGIRQEALGVADTEKAYAVKFDARTSACNVALSEDGVLLAINATPKPLNTTPVFTPAARPLAVNPRQYMSEEILAAGSTAKMAELTAQDIYDIRESRNLLVRGQADTMPKDGAQLQLMLNSLDEQDHALTSLFAGVTVRDTTEHSVTINADREIKQEVAFRFSKKLGLVDSDDLAGTPYYIKIADLRVVPKAEPYAKKNKQEPGIYVNVPGKMKVTLSDASGEVLASELPAPQFGNTELLSGALFNKRYTTHLWLNQLTGAVERLEAEQPK